MTRRLPSSSEKSSVLCEVTFTCDFVAGALQFFAASKEQVVQFVAMCEGIAENGRGDAMETFVEGIKQDQAVLGENAGKKCGEGATVGASRCVGLVEQIAKGLSEQGLSTATSSSTSLPSGMRPTGTASRRAWEVRRLAIGRRETRSRGGLRRRRGLPWPSRRRERRGFPFA